MFIIHMVCAVNIVKEVLGTVNRAKAVHNDPIMATNCSKKTLEVEIHTDASTPNK